MKKRIHNRTKEECRIEASKFTTRNEFKKSSKSIYNFAGRRGWLDEICSHMVAKRNDWSLEECMSEALKYQRRIDFSKSSSAHYYFARSRGWLDDICAHMPMIVNTKRTKEDCSVIASQFTRRVDFLRADSAAYQKADDAGWLDEICSHMKYAPPPLTNVLYLWKAKCSDIWKIGVSNEYCVDERISKVASEHGFEIELRHTIVRTDARKIEGLLLRMGERVSTLSRKTGFSEFRVLSKEEITESLKYFVKEKE